MLRGLSAVLMECKRGSVIGFRSLAIHQLFQFLALPQQLSEVCHLLPRLR